MKSLKFRSFVDHEISSSRKKQISRMFRKNNEIKKKIDGHQTPTTYYFHAKFEIVSTKVTRPPTQLDISEPQPCLGIMKHSTEITHIV